MVFEFKLIGRDLHVLRTILKLICMSYNDAFVVSPCYVGHQARQYLQGLLLNRGRGNCSRFAKRVRNGSGSSMQHFITNSPWNERIVIDRLQRDAAKLIGDSAEGSIHIDETGFPKQGKHSVGTQKQYCGRLGKVENCQVGVVLGYANGSKRILMDGRLYLPEKWAKDNKLRNECKVPKDVRFKTKAQIGLEMALGARNNGVPFGWIGMDCFYGEQPWLRNELDAEGLIFIADIPQDTRVWLSLPKTGIPERKRKVGRLPVNEKVLDGEPKPIEVNKIKDMTDTDKWVRVPVRETERKELKIDIACLRVYPVENRLPGNEVWLIIRKEVGTDIIKYQLSNAPASTDVKRLAKMSCSRYWIERAIEDAKGIGALADYEARSWRSWHHHVAMALLAMLAAMIMQLELGKKADLLTLQDIKDILEVILPKRIVRDRDILEIIKAKHKARLSARESHHRRSVAIIG
jgi:SRSO17 transposase